MCLQRHASFHTLKIEPVRQHCVTGCMLKPEPDMQQCMHSIAQPSLLTHLMQACP